MKKSDVTTMLSKELNLSLKKSAEVVDFVFEKMRDSLKNGKRIEVRGFGTFFVKSYKPRKGRNPKTGAIVDVPSKKLPFFKMGKEIKRKLIAA
jgi:integration host factor subunit beta